VLYKPVPDLKLSLIQILGIHPGGNCVENRKNPWSEAWSVDSVGNVPE
jgi:hypothetical protein